MSTWTFMNIKGQDHSLTLVQCHSDSILSNFFSLETTKPIEAKFHMEPPLDGGKRRLVQMVQVTWPRCPPCPYMVKNFKSLLCWNRQANDLETWYTASSTRVLPSLFKWCPRFDLDLFYGKVKFGPLCFCMGKNKQQIFQKLLLSMT